MKVLELESPRANFSEVRPQKKSTDKTKNDVTLTDNAVDIDRANLNWN